MAKQSPLTKTSTMKMTMHIEEALLDRVVREYGFSSKTEAVEAALREMDRRSRLRAFGEHGLGLTPEELKAAVDPDYDLEALRVAEIPRRKASVKSPVKASPKTSPKTSPKSPK